MTAGRRRLRIRVRANAALAVQSGVVGYASEIDEHRGLSAGAAVGLQRNPASLKRKTPDRRSRVDALDDFDALPVDEYASQHHILRADRPVTAVSFEVQSYG